MASGWNLQKLWYVRVSRFSSRAISLDNEHRRNNCLDELMFHVMHANILDNFQECRLAFVSQPAHAAHESKTTIPYVCIPLKH